MITLMEYWMGREFEYPEDLTPEIRTSAMSWVSRANEMLARAESAGIIIPINPETNSQLTSGWRPPAVNAKIPGAAKFSRHMTGQAGDIYDPFDGELDAFLFDHQEILADRDIDLYLEHPSATKGWSHTQTEPPRSQRAKPYEDRRRWFYP